MRRPAWLLLALLLPHAGSAQPGQAPTPGCLTCPPSRPNCRTLRSCAEAYFQLERCGFHGHDRDRDGIPCEVLCGINNRSRPPVPPPCPRR
jgi:hypothetical protein